MKLGIVVVYMFGAELEPLFELHLRQIERCTRVPYVIYCSVNRLAAEYRGRLSGNPNVRAFEFPAIERRDMFEHSYYLDRLIQIAIEDGATHIAVLHLDSFPLRPGWIEALTTHLNEHCVLVTVERIHTACLVFGRDWYLQDHPTMLPSESVQATPAFQAFVRDWNPEPHSGMGYGFAAYSHGRSCYYLPRSRTSDAFGRIYGDWIFHLVGTMRLEPMAGLDSTVAYSLPSRFLRYVSPVYMRLVPSALRLRLRAQFADRFDLLVDRPRKIVAKHRNDATMRTLRESPEAFLDQLLR